MTKIRSSAELLGWIQQATGTPPSWTTATVTSTSPLYVARDDDRDIDGNPVQSPVALKRLGSYTPTIGDRVLMLRTGKSWTVLGKIV